MELKELMLSLCSLMSISGHEWKSHKKLKEIVGGHFDEINEDAVGNIIFIRRCGKENAAKIMIDAHFDEIGMIVTAINDGGFLSVTSIGGLDEAILQASDVMIYGKETLRGVIASTPPHLQKAEDEKKLTEIPALLIDTGYTKEELEELVSLGTPVGFAPRYTDLLGENICGKSFDDKACAAAAIFGLASTKKEELAADVYLQLSCHEETVRIGGAAVGAYSVAPDYAMVIDVNLAEVPDVPRHETVDYCAGVSVAISAITDRKLTNMTMALCKEKEIKFTRVAAPSSTGTNTPVMNLAGRGVPTVDIGLPLKNMHTYNETLNMSDVRELAKLVSEFVKSDEIKEAFAI